MASVLDNFPAMPSTPPDPFVPRPFPPPALQNIPVPYILEQLHSLAVDFWDKPDTADCTIIVPIAPLTLPARYSTPMSPSVSTVSSSPHHATFTPTSEDPTGLARRFALHQAQMACVTRMTSRLHLDYLLAHSSLFRNLFRNGYVCGSPDLQNPNASTDSLASLSQSSGFGIPPSRLPRLLPLSTPTHPVVLLPLPDPASFPHLMHFMYFGTFTALETALGNGQLRWPDVVRNVEYLGMRTSIKAFLGRWYAHNTAFDSHGSSSSPPIIYGEDSDSADGDVEYDDDSDSADGMEIDEDGNEEHDNVSSSSDSDSEFDGVECQFDSGSDESLETLVDTPPPAGMIASKPIAICSSQEQHAAMLDSDFEPRRGRTRTRVAINHRAPFVSTALSRHKG